jgi:hypothetical protein
MNFFVATGMSCCHQMYKWLRYVGSIATNNFFVTVNYIYCKK